MVSFIAFRFQLTSMEAATVIVQRMNWAGILVQSGDTRIAIDPFYHVNDGFFGIPRETFIPLEDFGAVDAVFVTHIHSDHFDWKAIHATYGADVPVYVPAQDLEAAQQTDLENVNGVHLEDQVTIGSIRVIASRAVDGLGDAQLSWVVKADNQTILHSGDTLWHGYWWEIAKQHGPFDAVYLPVNGAIVMDDGMTPSGEPICMTPEQAVSAAVVLGTERLVPIHFAAFHNPPVYLETPDMESRLYVAAKAKGVTLHVLKPGDRMDLKINGFDDQWITSARTNA